MKSIRLVLYYDAQTLQFHPDIEGDGIVYHQIHSLFNHSHAIKNNSKAVNVALAALANRYEYQALINEIVIQHGNPKSPKFYKINLLNAQTFQTIRHHFALKKHGYIAKVLFNIFKIDEFEQRLIKNLFTFSEQNCLDLAKHVKKHYWYLPKAIRKLLGLISVETALNDLAEMRAKILTKPIPGKFSEQFPSTKIQQNLPGSGSNNQDGFGGGGMLNPNNEVEPQPAQEQKKSVSKEMTKLNRGGMK